MGRSRKLVEQYNGTTPPAGAGEHPQIVGSGWQAAWDSNLPTTQAARMSTLNACGSEGTWTDTAGANGGRTPSAVEDVIAAVAGAYKAETYAVSGRVWRNGETFPVTVELPIPGNSANKPRAQYLAPRSTGGP